MSFLPQVTLKEILAPAGQGRLVGAFNVHNTEFILGVVRAAENTGRPAILMINEKVLKYGRLDCLGAAALTAARGSEARLAVMVDHGTDETFLKQALGAGMDVMYDGSLLPFEQNIRNTRELVGFAHRLGRCVEGEIGVLGLQEDGEDGGPARLTTVEQATEFSARTGVDVLAIAVGNAHGAYPGAVDIDVKRIAAIHGALPGLALVMHGGSGIPPETIRRSAQAGIVKFNVATDLKTAYVTRLQQLMGCQPPPVQPLELFPPLAKAVEEEAERKIRLFDGEEDQ